MNKIAEAYVGMHTPVSAKKTPQNFISEAKKEIANESDNDYINDPEVQDLIENYTKSDLISMVTFLAKKLAV